MGEQVVLVKWPEGCIAMFSVERWQQVAADIVAGGNSAAESRKIRRLLGSGTSIEQVDKQGRVNVPQSLREHAGIERECVIVGSLDHGEVWEPAAWEREQAEGELEDLASKLDF